MKVGDYIAKQPVPQKEILQKLRRLIFAVNPKIFEEIKMGVPWYEGKFYLVGLKDHVNLGIAYAPFLEKYKEVVKGKGQYMRHIKFRDLSDINEARLIELIKETDKVYKNPHPKEK